MRGRNEVPSLGEAERRKETLEFFFLGIRHSGSDL